MTRDFAGSHMKTSKSNHPIIFEDYLTIDFVPSKIQHILFPQEARAFRSACDDTLQNPQINISQFLKRAPKLEQKVQFS